MVAGYDLGAFEGSEELGGEKITNGTFDSDISGWTPYAGSRGDVLYSNGRLKIDNTTGTGNQIAKIDASFTSGKVYKISFDYYHISGSTSSTINLFLGTADQIVVSITSGQTTTAYMKAGADRTTFMIGYGGGDVYELDNISVKKVLQSEVSDTYPAIIDVNEPVLGVNLWDNDYSSGIGSWDGVLNNTVTNDSGAIKITYVDHQAGALIYLRDSDDLSSDLTVGSLYKLTFKAKVNTGSVTFRVSATSAYDLAITETDFTSKTIYFTATSTNGNFIEQQSMGSGEIIWLKDFALKEVKGNVGTMTNQDSADLVYSSVLPDQSFLTGVNSAYNFFNFDGTNEYIEGSDTIPAFGTDPFSVSVWVNPTSTAQDGLFANAGSLSGDYFFLSISATNFVGTGTTSAWKHRFDSSDTQLNTWQLLTYVREGTGTNQSKWYINGELKDTSTDTTNWLTGNGWHIGAYGDSIGHFPGSIGQLAIWNDALTASEVSAVYNLGRHSNLLDSYSDNLIAYWAMGALDAKTGLSDVGDGTIYDRSGNSNHGTATNTESADLKSSPNAEPNGYAKGDTNRSTTTP
tara:strand:- start:24 stop:1745 length:1722 start_codon:yes stop_codon:yes gene_type:complete